MGEGHQMFHIVVVSIASLLIVLSSLGIVLTIRELIRLRKESNAESGEPANTEKEQVADEESPQSSGVIDGTADSDEQKK